MWGRATGVAAALLMGTPGLAAPASSVIWVELCDAGHRGVRIPLPLRREGDDGPAKACHAACSIRSDRRLRVRPKTAAPLTPPVPASRESAQLCLCALKRAILELGIIA